MRRLLCRLIGHRERCLVSQYGRLSVLFVCERCGARRTHP